jgi:hypothetical protein
MKIIILALALTTALAACSIDTDPDKDGDGKFTMNGKKNERTGYYEYEFKNSSDYEITVTAGSHYKTTLKTRYNTSATITDFNSSSLTVKYSPSDKVKPGGGSSPVYFHNR